MTLKRAIGFTAILLGLSVGAWFGLDAARPWAPWVSLYAPSQTAAGLRFPIRVLLNQPPQPGILGVDLHTRIAGKDVPMVIGVSATQLDPGRMDYSVEIPVRTNASPGRIRAVLYLTPTGRWRDRIRSAISDDIQVVQSPAPDPTALNHLVRRRVFNLGTVSEVPRIRNLKIRYAVAAAWLGCAAWCLRHLLKPRSSTGARDSAEGTHALGWLAAACILAGLGEAIDLSRLLGETARGFARSHSAYEAREPGQQIASAIAIAFLLALISVIARLRARPAFRLACIGVLLHLAFLALDAMSLHAFDEWAALTWLGVPLIQWTGIAAAILGITGVATLRTDFGDPKPASTLLNPPQPPGAGGPLR